MISLAGVIAWFLSISFLADPVSHALVSSYRNAIREESPIIRAGVQYDGWYDGHTGAISIDWPRIRALLPREDDARAVAACLAVHEAVHRELGDASHRLPLLHQYVCLDRMGAPEWIKDMAYWQLERLMVTPAREEED